MPARDAPDLTEAIHPDALIDPLRRDCPLNLPLQLAQDRRTEVQLWRMPVILPPGRHAAAYRRLLVDVSRVFELHRRHSRDPERTTVWYYDYHYLEVLEKEQRLQPRFWIKQDHWVIARRAHQRSTGSRLGRQDKASRQRWGEYWTGLLRRGIVRWKSPEAWVTMLTFNEQDAAAYHDFQKGLQFRMVPIYTQTTADDLRSAMLEDLANFLLYVPSDAADGERHRSAFARRLGISPRWPTQKDLLLYKRKEVVLAWVREGVAVGDLGAKMVEAGLYPIRQHDVDPSYDREDQLRNATRTAYRLVTELIDERLVDKGRVHRRPRGRPPEQGRPG